jgi:TPR repeat protein
MAQWMLGSMYQKGQGVVEDYAEAARWYRKAADQGDTFAQWMLGTMYENGQGVGQDYAEAAHWYRKAADLGDADAQWLLGRMYWHGKGVAQDYVQAHMWMNLAASGANGDRQRIRAGARDEAAGKMTSGQIAEAHRLAREWKPKTAKPRPN